MGHFRKKPIVVSAEQWFPGTVVDGVRIHFFDPYDRGTHAIQTLEGWMQVSPGDWIITGIAGERYPCKPDIFERTYEPVEEGSQ